MRSRTAPEKVLDWSGDGARRNGRRLDNTLGSAALGLLLALEVASLVAGAGTIFFASIVVAWIVLPAVVGLKNVLDAGCFFMLVSLGIVVVVDLAGHVRVPFLT
jgi:hypothetical protein